MTWLNVMEYLCHKWPRIHSTCLNTSWHITWFVTRLTRWVSLVEQELLTLPEHLSSSPVFSGVRVTLSIGFIDRCLSFIYVCFVDCCLSFCTFSFWALCVCSSSIYGFWLPLWYLQTLLITIICHLSMRKTCVTWTVCHINVWIVFCLSTLQYLCCSFYLSVSCYWHQQYLDLMFHVKLSIY
jgi:hypothetical protein